MLTSGFFHLLFYTQNNELYFASLSNILFIIIEIILAIPLFFTFINDSHSSDGVGDEDRAGGHKKKHKNII